MIRSRCSTFGPARTPASPTAIPTLCASYTSASCGGSWVLISRGRSCRSSRGPDRRRVASRCSSRRGARPVGTQSSRMRELLSVEEYIEELLRLVALDDRVESVPVADSLGRVLAQEVESSVSIPVFDNSAMDGYAVRWADVTAVPARSVSYTHLRAH